MAERSAVSSKLKLVLSYLDESGEARHKSVQMRNLVINADANSVITAVDALGTLYDDPIVTVREVVENEIVG
ncbi:hypothetical protein [uncultured Megasphaera sp.]|uniref:DUF1659 domain-containing protein n=1 Tax=uncultured Megasphaera sp. TaxID=165188 RepID=UPI002622084F|nr:hypothetical protein [uncultured Megasphaera sp.]